MILIGANNHIDGTIIHAKARIVAQHVRGCSAAVLQQLHHNVLQDVRHVGELGGVVIIQAPTAGRTSFHLNTRTASCTLHTHFQHCLHRQVSEYVAEAMCQRVKLQQLAASS